MREEYGFGMGSDTMKDRQREHLISWMTEAASEFIVRSVSFPNVLITVTRVDIPQTAERAIIYISVWPETKEVEVLKSIRALRRDFYEYAKQKFILGRRIAVDFAIDHGEKARRNVEELLKNG